MNYIYMNMKSMKKKNDDQILIRSILGVDKFLMLNLNLIKIVGLNESVILTYILDKLEHTLSWDKDVIDTGIVVFRRDIENKFGLSDYQQRKVERNLITKELLTITATFDGLNTYNIYKVDLEKLFDELNSVENNK
jgi:hypothetical protein